MARSQYQYQPIVGPVWRAAVAASLAWLPAGNAQPQRGLPPNRPSDVVQPFTEAIDTARQLRWLPNGNLFVRALPPNKLGGEVAPFIEAVNVARNLTWIPNPRGPLPPERRLYDWTVLAPFQEAAAPFDPALFPWNYVVQPLPLERRIPTWIVLDPFPRPAVAFDPASLTWQPSEARYPARALARGRYDYTEVVAGIYDPAGLDWHGQTVRLNPLQRRIPTWSILHPFPVQVVAFDPATFPYVHTPRWVILPRGPLGGEVGPIFAALYRPEGLQWTPVIGWPAQTLAAIRTGASLLDPFPIPPPPPAPSAILQRSSDP